MCGICGFAGPGTRDDLLRMTRALALRGPDGEGLWQAPDEPVFLGHRRLSVIDLSGGAQPMEDADGRVAVVFNGEIYNHAELRAELTARGRRFVTDHSDTEVLVQGYLEWGEDLCRRLNGMWAFALYDRKQRRFFLSRDRFGEKPLFYTHHQGLFAFASELSALSLHPLADTTVSPLSVKKYFAHGFIPAPHSLYARVRKLPPGCSLTWDLGGAAPSVRPYWEFVIEPSEPGKTDNELAEELSGLLETAVRRRLMSDVPIGVLLSGGLDSSSITAFASQHIQTKPLKTFSIGFADKSFDESPWAARVAGLFATSHHHAELSMDQARGILPQIARGLDEPMGDSSLAPTWLLCQETRKRVTVALGGDGGDELFAGYDPFRALLAARAWAAIVPRPMHRAVRVLAGLLPVSHANISLDFALKRTLRGLSYPPRLWNPVWMGPLEPAELSELFREPVDLEEIYEEAIALWDAHPGLSLVDRTLMFFTRFYLADGILVKTDRASMMHSLEVRSPFLDPDLAEFVRRLPSRYKFNGRTTKALLKTAMEQHLPRDVVRRKKKGFGMPVGQWFAKDGIPLSGGLWPGDVFTPRAVEQHRAGKADHRLFLYNAWLLRQMLGEEKLEGLAG
ncbi:MAG: asparagine synthase (glutamine-hydrolyzing) [Proteobacteria bacterium]|nr:asparagine synthase (glutamine-hydrolyzing) [Pseudomonadota bacterium]